MNYDGTDKIGEDRYWFENKMDFILFFNLI